VCTWGASGAFSDHVAKRYPGWIDKMNLVAAVMPAVTLAAL
jgi:hypothetical protein